MWPLRRKATAPNLEWVTEHGLITLARNANGAALYGRQFEGRYER
jgi:hypothetical protein